MIRLEFGSKGLKRSIIHHNFSNKSSSIHAYIRKLGVFDTVQTP